MGYLNGIEDRFNLCNGDYDETYTLFHAVWEQVYKPVLLATPHPAPSGYEMSKGLLLALRVFNPSLKWICFMKYWYAVLGLPGEFVIESRRNKLRYQVMKFSLGTLLRLQLFHWVYGSLFRSNRKRQAGRKKQIEERLRQQFPDISYAKCPFSFDIDALTSV